MTLPGSYSLKWHGHGSHLNTSISGLYHCDAFTDVVLATSDGCCISGHQFVLSSCSPYLHNMFILGGSSAKNSAKIVVVLPSEINHTTLGILLQYMYRGEAIVNHEQLPSIMKAAELLQIRGLCSVKDQSDSRSSSGVLRQQNKNNSESRNSVEKVKPNHKLLIPELKYHSETSNSPNSISNGITRSSPLKNNSPQRKKHKNNSNEVHKKGSVASIVEDIMIEKMVVGEEIQVKEEPIDWDEPRSNSEDYNILKQEVVSEAELEIEEDHCYVPLTCDLCQATFTTPALWVRHIETTHPTTALASGKRGSVESNSTEYPPLHCELCQQVFTVPAEWVRHIQSHTEQQLPEPRPGAHSPRGRVECTICGKVLQSQASMQIHARTHTGERPYLCKICGREFNVKSNYLRHMRTLHDQRPVTPE